MAAEFDVIVAGAGIAGLTAGVTSARLGRRTLVLTGDVLGGQLLSIEKVDGYPGFPEGVPGYDLCPIAQEQAATAGAEFETAEVTALARQGGRWLVTTPGGDYLAPGLVVATGAALKSLGVPGEERLHGKGVSHCATCDGPMLRNRVCVVAGGGDSAMQESLTLAAFASRVILVNAAAGLTGQASYRERVAAQPKIEHRANSAIAEILGDDKVRAVRIRDMSAGAVADVEADGVFVYIGLRPTAGFLAGLLALDAAGAVPTDAQMRTALPGLCAAGTVRAGSPGRAVASGGEGAAAAITIDRYLADGRWRDESVGRAAALAAAGG